jgi:hypothetical protein
MTDVGKAFDALLLAPLQALHERDPSQSVVLIVDALDEADPPRMQQRQQQPQKDQGPSGVGSGGAKPLPVCPPVCGNRALQLITEHLRRLPACVRFIFTTRPDAAAGQVLPCLRRTFGGAGAVDAVDAGGVVEVQPAALRASQLLGASVAGASAAAAVRGVMVYHTAAACLPAQQRAAPPQCPTLQDVYGVYGRVFDAAGGNGVNGGGGGYAADLLAVAMAAKTPLSQSMLQQMGLGDEALARVPGGGRLFFVDEHHLYALHK